MLKGHSSAKDFAFGDSSAEEEPEQVLALLPTADLRDQEVFNLKSVHCLIPRMELFLCQVMGDEVAMLCKQRPDHEHERKPKTEHGGRRNSISLERGNCEANDDESLSYNPNHRNGETDALTTATKKHKLNDLEDHNDQVHNERVVEIDLLVLLEFLRVGLIEDSQRGDHPGQTVK